MATIKDVCKLAGVSKATVSRVINGTGQVKESTTQSVLSAMQQLNFKPNRLAQALANNSSNCIGLILSDFAGDYFSTILKQAAKAAELANKQLIVTDGHDTPEREIEAIDSLVEHCCDAIVLYSRRLSQEELSRLEARIDVPIVVLNRQLKNKNGYTVCFDQQSIARLAVEQLLELQHSEIAYITSPLDTSTGKLRLQAYNDTLLHHNITPEPALITEGNYTLNSGYHACKKILETGHSFSALFSSNDDMAVGAIRALMEAGKRVPEDISVISIDNSPISEFIQPTLSSVDLPIKELIDAAMRVALELADGKDIVAENQAFLGRVILRESTALKR